MKVRDAVNVEIEKLRQAKVVGKSLEARVTLGAAGELRALLERYRDDLPTLFIASDVTLDAGPVGGDAVTYKESDESWTTIVVTRAEGAKCDRCWRYVPAVGDETSAPGLCPRCEGALAEARL